MLSLKDLNDLLDRIPVWRKMLKAPERIDVLEARIAAIEERLGSAERPGQGDMCPFCRTPNGELQQLTPLRGFGGAVQTGQYRCSRCHKEYTREIEI